MKKLRHRNRGSSATASNTPTTSVSATGRPPAVIRSHNYHPFPAQESQPWPQLRVHSPSCHQPPSAAQPPDQPPWAARAPVQLPVAAVASATAEAWLGSASGGGGDGMFVGNCFGTGCGGACCAACGGRCCGAFGFNIGGGRLGIAGRPSSFATSPPSQKPPSLEPGWSPPLLPLPRPRPVSPPGSSPPPPRSSPSPPFSISFGSS